MTSTSTDLNAEIPILAGHEQLSDIEIPLRAELDQRTFTFEQLLNLNVGSIVSLGRATGENVDVYAGEVLLGSGEILIVDLALAIRMADLRGRPSAK